jgi:prevent-host-death family protein
MPSPSIGVREAKVNLSKYLKLVQNGVEVIITDRGRPVGKIVPMPMDDLSLEERLKRAQDAGLVEIAPEEKKRPKIPMPIPLKDNIAQKFLQEDRNGG